MRPLLLLSLLLPAACLWQGESPVLNGVDTRITFLHTSDMHSRLFPFELAPTATDNRLGLEEGNQPFGGAARLAYMIRRERARADRVLHFDSGDPFQGAPVFNDNHGEPEFRFLSMVEADAMVIGNHEFDAGPDNLVTQLQAWASYPVLTANYRFPDPDDPNENELGRLAQPFYLYNVDGLRIAAIGLGDLHSLSSIGEGGNSLGITPLEPNEITRTYVRLLHDTVDLVVVVSHLGLSSDEHLVRGYERTVWEDRVQPGWEIRESLGDGRVVVWIPGVRGIDIVFGGHLHIVLSPPKLVRDPDGREVPIVHSGAFAKYLGRFDAVVRDDDEFGGKRLVSHKYQVFPVDARLAPYEDEEVNRVYADYNLRLNRGLDLRRVIGYAPRTIMRRGQGANGDSELGTLVAESMRQRRRVEAEIGLTNTLGVRDNFYRGPITLEDMFNVFPFENTVTVMYLSGREMQELVDFITERSASRGCQSQAQTAGLAFTMNCGQVIANERNPAEYLHPGEEISINGQTLDPTGTYKIATNDYIANGGSGFKVLKRNTTKIDTGLPMRSALIDYIGLLEPCGVYEVQGPMNCLNDDQYSRLTCEDTVDCSMYINMCAAGRIARLPNVCLQSGDMLGCPCEVGSNPSAPREQGGCGAQPYKGAYADTPCVVGQPGGHIKRKTAEDLDQLPDYTDPDWGQ